MKKKIKSKAKRYIVIMDMSGEDSETEIHLMTKEELEKDWHRDFYAVIDGEIIKSFEAKFDSGRLKNEEAN